MIEAVQLHKEYRMGESVVHALNGVSVSLNAGDFVSLTGASGSGKSTLMHILGCLDRPTAGSVRMFGEQIAGLGDRQLARIRNQYIGFVFQTFNLINRTTALENVLVPLVYTRQTFSKKYALEALERVGLARRARHRPNELSGGECQRVAIARAIVNRPKLLLADEPTGNLDTKTGQQIMEIFHELHAEGMTIVLVTHEMDVAIQARRMIQMRDGKVIEDTAIDDERREAMLAGSRESHARMTREKTGRKAGTRLISPVPQTDGS